MELLPEIHFKNLFESDPIGQKLWRHHLGKKTFEDLWPTYQRMGENAAKATEFSRIADRSTPFLKEGQVCYDPAFETLKQLSYGEGIISRKYDPQFLQLHKANRHFIGFSVGYYFAQTETGLYCPICMTDALGRVLERNEVSFPEAKETLKHIGSANLKELWQGAMFLTEKQGGSDVGANKVQALHKDGKWFLSGEKWFCSNADAEASLVLARMPQENGEAIAGTKGLGLFLLLRNRPQNNFKNWNLKRLKDKLGVRSMASGEIDLDNAQAFLVGGVNEGFKIMTEMVNMSRLYNSVASIAVARRAVLEANEFGKKRQAFGQSLKDLTLWRTTIADLSAEVFGMQVFVFEAIKLLDLMDAGDLKAGQLLRLMTPIAKGLSGKLSVFAARESMELIGGNAYIEDHIMPRLLRDALVLPIWEGTTNIQSLDLLRALKKEGPDALNQRLDRALKSRGADLSNEKMRSVLEQRIKDFKIWMQKNSNSERAALELMSQLGRVLTLAFLFEISVNSELKEICEAAFERIHLRSEMFQSLGMGEASSLEAEKTLLQI